MAARGRPAPSLCELKAQANGERVTQLRIRIRVTDVLNGSLKREPLHHAEPIRQLDIRLASIGCETIGLPGASIRATVADRRDGEPESVLRPAGKCAGVHEA